MGKACGILSWIDKTHYSSSYGRSIYTFQVYLYEDGVICFKYLNMPLVSVRNPGIKYTCGIGSTTTNHYQLQYGPSTSSANASGRYKYSHGGWSSNAFSNADWHPRTGDSVTFIPRNLGT